MTVDKTFSIVDLNGDGILDISNWTAGGLSIHPGLNTASLVFRSNLISITNSNHTINPLYNTFVDWNDNGNYDCLYSDYSGNIMVMDLKTFSTDTLLKIPGSRLYPVVCDVDNDHKKDLIVHSEGKGLFVYKNTGIDSDPAFQFATECTNPSGESFISMQGSFVMVDIDGDGSEEFIIRDEGVMKIFHKNDQFTELTYSEDLNCAGTRHISDSSDIVLIGSPQGMPGLLLRTGNKLIVYFTRIMGDINGDGRVDIRDIGEISRKWEATESDSDWNPHCNLKLSQQDGEVIDIRDISRASKCWELQE